MSERKVINKYYPRDFDPLEAERALKRANKSLKNQNNGTVTVRLMTPFSIRCLKCDEYIPRSKKFNGRKEILDQKYLQTFKIYRLHIRCPRCANDIGFRTDPQSSDYVMEFGGTRNYAGRLKENAKNMETADEALQRLLREHNNDQNLGEDKVRMLEERLFKLQRQQEEDEQLLKLKTLKAEQQRKLVSLPESSKIQENDDELDRLAEMAFENRKNNTTSAKVFKTLRNEKPFSRCTRAPSNSLGIRIKR